MGSWEGKIDINKVFILQPTRPLTYFGIGALAKLDGILADMAKAGQDKILVVTDPVAYKACGAWGIVRPMLDRHVAWEHFDGVRPNPTYANCEAAAVIGRDCAARAVLAIGGGSAIDTAKTAAVLLNQPNRRAVDFYEKGVRITGALPIVAVNTTHGTGSECNSFAVAQSDGEDKPALRSPHLYPTYSIEDPKLTATMPVKQTVSSAVDAFIHALEAATATTASPYSICLAKEVVRLTTTYLTTAISQPGNLTARYWLMYASAIAGLSFDQGLLHITHALEHAMSTLNADIPHGQGLGILLPATIREIYPAVPEVLAEILAPIAPELRGIPGEGELAAAKIKEWFAAIGQPVKMGAFFTGVDVPALGRMAMKSLLSKMLLPFAPIPVDADVMERIFQRSL
ncbi:MAG: iron-containing alcohol dehydrogenase [Solidesulfovibrio sp.]